ncbi:hypothetical protein T439DRAFT_376946 [Meredithblackwellia eburnea MCA 4105]
MHFTTHLRSHAVEGLQLEVVQDSTATNPEKTKEKVQHECTCGTTVHTPVRFDNHADKAWHGGLIWDNVHNQTKFGYHWKLYTGYEIPYFKYLAKRHQLELATNSIDAVEFSCPAQEVVNREVVDCGAHRTFVRERLLEHIRECHPKQYAFWCKHIRLHYPEKYPVCGYLPLLAKGRLHPRQRIATARVLKSSDEVILEHIRDDHPKQYAFWCFHIRRNYPESYPFNFDLRVLGKQHLHPRQRIASARVFKSSQNA